LDGTAWLLICTRFGRGISTDQTLPARSTSNTPGEPGRYAVGHRSPVTRRAGYGAAPPPSRVAARSLRDGLRPPLTPEPLRPLADQRQGRPGGLPPGRVALARIGSAPRHPAATSHPFLAVARTIGTSERAFSPRTPGWASTTPRHQGLNRRVRLIVNRAYGISPQTQALGLIMLTLGPIDHVLPHERTTPADPLNRPTIMPGGPKTRTSRSALNGLPHNSESRGSR